MMWTHSNQARAISLGFFIALNAKTDRPELIALDGLPYVGDAVMARKALAHACFRRDAFAEMTMSFLDCPIAQWEHGAEVFDPKRQAVLFVKKHSHRGATSEQMRERWAKRKAKDYQANQEYMAELAARSATNPDLT